MVVVRVKVMKNCLIKIDTREPQSIQGLTWNDALVSTAQLDAGDIEIMTPDGHLILIERKTPRDLLDSIKDRRLFNQCEAMVKRTQWSYLVVCGVFLHGLDDCVWIDRKPDKTNWSWHSLQGALLSVQELGVGIIYDADFQGAVERIVNRSRNDVKITPRRESYVFEAQESLLMALPGIGSKKAVELCKLFPALANTLVWLTHPEYEEPKIKGIGKKTREKIRGFFGGGLEIDYE